MHYWAGNATEVLNGYQNLPRNGYIPADVLLLVSRTYRVSGQPYDALLASQRALALQPHDADVIRNHDLALHAASLYRQALEWQTQHASVFSAKEKRNRQADYAAELTRLAPPTYTNACRTFCFG